jgi:hypothetical protein
MILNEKDLDIETLMLQLDFENVGNSMHVPNHKKVHEQNFTTNEINNEFEPQLQGVKLPGVNQRFILQHRLGMSRIMCRGH